MKFTVPGRPCSKNEAWAPRPGGGVMLTRKAREYIARVQAAAVEIIGHQRPAFKGDGIVVLATGHFTKNADAGAVWELVQDALQGIAYGNDSQVFFAGGWKGDPDPENPRTEVILDQLVMGASDLVLPIPPFIWRSAYEQSKRDMLGILPSKAREKIVARKLTSSAKRYGNGG